MADDNKNSEDMRQDAEACSDGTDNTSAETAPDKESVKKISTDGSDDNQLSHENEDDGSDEDLDESDGESEFDAVDTNVMEKCLDEMYRPDAETEKSLKQEWKDKRKGKKLTPLNTLLMIGVIGFVPWYLYNNRQDIAYFFTSSEPVELGQSDIYRLVEGEKSVPQNFPDNRYAHITGIPIHHIVIQRRESFIAPKTQKLVYQLMGSSVYVEENAENSQFAKFISNTSSTFNLNAGVQPVDIKGRLRRFDTDEAKQYATVRDYYTKNYGTMFCKDMSEAERRHKASLLGRGGVAVQIMPDGSVIQSDTDTHAAIIDIEPLHGREAMALTDNNTLLHTIDAGLMWRQTKLKGNEKASALTFDGSLNQILFGGKSGWIGNETAEQPPEDLKLTQDITDLTFTAPEPGDDNVPSIIAVGREGLIQTAYADREGWIPARIDSEIRYNDVLRAGDQVFVAGDDDTLMRRTADPDIHDAPWTKDVSPMHADWLGLTQIPGYVVATGTKGAVARYDLTSADPHWEQWPVDDVPGIEFEADIRSSAVSDDGSTWVAVGDAGNILVAKRGEDGKFGRIQRISGEYAGYGVVRDILAGNSVEASLYEALQRHTTEDLYDITYHKGTFYAVGSESLIMTSKDGLSWSKRTLHVRHKTLRTIEFTAKNQGFIGGEKGLMFMTADEGATWRGKRSPTERSIYDIRTSPEYPDGFIFTGAYGLWGFCDNTNDKCYLRSRNADYHYRAIEFAKGPQKPGYFRVIPVGGNSRVDQIDDAPNNGTEIYALRPPERSTVHAIAVTDEELPLKPNAPRGQLDLISTGSGTIYRAYDGGYTFRREDTGMIHPITRLIMTADGSYAWGFDGKGAVVEDVDGRGQWKPLVKVPENDAPAADAGPRLFTDGAFIGRTGYLIDAEGRCVYRKKLAPNAEIERLACLADPSVQLKSITASGAKLLLGHRSSSAPDTLNRTFWSPESVTGTDAAAAIAVDTAPGFPAAYDGARLIACGETAALYDAKAHTLTGPGGAVTKNVADVICTGGEITSLSVTPAAGRPGIFRLTAANSAPIWTVNVGFDASRAKFSRNASGRWWIAAESPDSAYPLILMSNDGKKWSWRRDRITDFQAVDTAGPKAAAVGDNGTILYSEDYGQSWNNASTSTNRTLRDVCLSSDGTFAVAVGDGGTVYRSQKSLARWTKLKYKLDIDLTSCTIAEQKDRFQVYIAGKGGAIYTSPDPDLGRLDLVASPAVEDIYSIAALESGEVIAVGGNYQDPATICEEGFIIESERTPRGMWLTILIALGFAIFWVWTLRMFILSVIHRNDDDEDDII